MYQRSHWPSGFPSLGRFMSNGASAAVSAALTGPGAVGARHTLTWNWLTAALLRSLPGD